MTDTNFVATHELIEVSNPLNQDREFISIAAESSGGYVMSWTSAFDSVNNTDEIYVQRFNADGTEFGSAFQVNSTTAGNQTQSQVAVLNNGDIVVTWQSANQDGDENGIYMQRFNSAGVPLGTETLVNTTTTGNQYDAEVIALSGGDFAVIWSDEDDPGNVASIRMQRYNSDGTTNGSELVLHSENLSGTVFNDIEVVELTGGRLAISWDRFSFSGQANDTAQLAIYTQAGVQISAPVDPQQTPDEVLTDPATGIVALGNGNVLITWVASYNMNGANNVGYSDIMGRIYDQNGVAQTSEFAITAGMDNRRFAIFAESDGNGGALIGYIEEGATVFYKPLEIVHLDQNGNIIAEAIWASPNENRGTDFATMVILSNGDVIVAYQDSLGGGDINHHRLVDGTDNRFDATANTVTLLDTGEAVTGLEGDDNITGGTGDDLIGGGKGVDTIDGGGGDDTLQGNEDDDILSGGDGEDVIVGGSGNDTINGDDHNDLLDGMTGDDTINGGDGVDTIYGGAGSDTINGGEGDDFLFGFREGPGGPFIAPGEDTDVGFTNIINGEGGHDRINGGRGDDIINGGEGDDIMNGDVLGLGFGGSDLFIASNGADSSNGGIGFDTIDYSGMNGALTVLFRANPASTFDFRGTVLIEANGSNPQYAQFFNEIERLIATDLADTITGFTEEETIEGRGGDDRISGGGGNDTLDGGTETDTAVFRNAVGNYDFDVEGVTLNVTDNFAGATNDGMDMLDNFELLEFDGVLYTLRQGTTTAQTIVGGAGNDLFVADDGADYLLDTAGGDDVLFGGEGNDQLQGSGGADQNFGGGGTDQVRYANSASGVTVNLATGAASGGDAAGDTFDSIENIAGSQHGDMLTGDAGVNDIQGLGGNDTINGGAGADTLNGGGGIDTLDYADSASSGPTGRSFGVTDVNGVYVTLGGGVQEGGDAQGDVALLFENVTGTQFNDWLTGTNEENTLTGGDGHDWLLDLAGNDTLLGGIGNDWLQGGEGGDVNNGGGDTDRVRYTQSDDVVNVNLTTGMGTGGHAQGDTYIDVEDITGSYGFGDILTGNGVNNLIEGLTGNDHLDGGTGLDVDLLAGGIGFDIFHFSSAVWGSDYLIDFEDGIDRIDLAGSGLTLGDFTQVDTAYGLRLDYNDGINGLQNIVIAGLDAGDITSADFV